jgi:hypothetical protein
VLEGLRGSPCAAVLWLPAATLPEHASTAPRRRRPALKFRCLCKASAAWCCLLAAVLNSLWPAAGHRAAGHGLPTAWSDAPSIVVLFLPLSALFSKVLWCSPNLGWSRGRSISSSMCFAPVRNLQQLDHATLSAPKLDITTTYGPGYPITLPSIPWQPACTVSFAAELCRSAPALRVSTNSMSHGTSMQCKKQARLALPGAGDLPSRYARTMAYPAPSCSDVKIRATQPNVFAAYVAPLSCPVLLLCNACKAHEAMHATWSCKT